MVATAASAQVSFGIQGGVNLSNVTHSVEEVSTNPKFGFNAGILADFGLTHNMGIRSGLFFHTKGFRAEITEADIIDVRSTTNLMYLQIPVHFAYKVDVMPGTRIVFHAGPYVAYGIGGSQNFEVRRSPADIQWGDESPVFGDDGFNRFDFGLGLGVGVEFGRFLTGIGWDMGLLNLANDNRRGFSEVPTIRNQNAYLTVGFRF